MQINLYDVPGLYGSLLKINQYAGVENMQPLLLFGCNKWPGGL